MTHDHRPALRAAVDAHRGKLLGKPVAVLRCGSPGAGKAGPCLEVMGRIYRVGSDDYLLADAKLIVGSEPHSHFVPEDECDDDGPKVGSVGRLHQPDVRALLNPRHGVEHVTVSCRFHNVIPVGLPLLWDAVNAKQADIRLDPEAYRATRR